jgi:hypothetical protein
MSNFEKEIDGKRIRYIDPSDDSSDWFVVQEESLSLDKGQLILNQFKQEFPHFNVNSYDELTEACSRSEYFNDWLINANLKFSEFSQVPLFLKDSIKGEEFKEIQNNLTKVNKIIGLNSQKKQKLAAEYKNSIKHIDLNEKNEIGKILDSNKILKILSLKSTYLPFSIQLMIQKYVPNDLDEVQESRRMYGRECLIRYKKYLVDLVISDPTFDIDAEIESNKIK